MDESTNEPQHKGVIANVVEREADQDVIKKAFMIKRSLGKSRLLLQHFNYKQRWFILTQGFLMYCDGTPERVGKLKGEIQLKNVTFIEALDDDALDRKSAFQIGYIEGSSDLTLYIIANSDVQREEWLHDIRQLCRNNKNLRKRYHSCIYTQQSWKCCEETDKLHEGCCSTTPIVPKGPVPKPRIPEIPSRKKDLAKTTFPRQNNKRVVEQFYKKDEACGVPDMNVLSVEVSQPANNTRQDGTHGGKKQKNKATPRVKMAEKSSPPDDSAFYHQLHNLPNSAESVQDDKRRVGTSENPMDYLAPPDDLTRQDTWFYIKESGRQIKEHEEKHLDGLPEATEKTPLLRKLSVISLDSDSSDVSDAWSTWWQNCCNTCRMCACEISDKTKIKINNFKIFLLAAGVLLCCLIFSIAPVSDIHWYQFAVSDDVDRSINLTWSSLTEVLQVRTRGPFLNDDAAITKARDNVTFYCRRLYKNGSTEIVSEIWTLAMQEDIDITGELTEQVTLQHDFHIDTEKVEMDGVAIYQLHVECTADYLATLVVQYANLDYNAVNQIVYAAVVLVGVYVLIIFEFVHRTLAAMIGAFAIIAVMAYLRVRPTLAEIMTWIDFETLGLLFGMMTIVSIFMETGFFDFVAVQSYKYARGRVWPLITALCVFAAVISAFMDNVTTILLLVPVSIRLCEVLNLDPMHVLIAEVVFSNIGGTATAIGDPPNVIIVSNEDLMKMGINFNSFTLHMVFGVILCGFVAYGQMRVMYRRRRYLQFKDPPDVVEIHHEIEMWKRTKNSVMYGTRDAERVRALLDSKMTDLETRMIEKKQSIATGNTFEEDFQSKLAQLQKEYKIKDKVLLIKSAAVLVCCILLFFLEPLEALHISLAWIAIMGAIILLVLADRDDLDSVFHKVEWTTLIFFAALFVLMKGIEKMGLLDFIGNAVADLIGGVQGSRRQLLVAILLILWVSALASSFVDNIPFTTAMVTIIVQLAEDPKLNLPVAPLVWSLAFGACLGGNGTLIGASCNVVCAGLAEQYGYKFTFADFFKIGFPMMIMSVMVATLYLLICHVVIGWNDV